MGFVQMDNCIVAPYKNNFTSNFRPKIVETFGKYKILKRLGCGLQGEVVLASQPSQSELVAIKICKDPLRKTALLKEVKAMRLVSHKGVLAAGELIQYKGKIGVVMEYAKNGDLFEIVANTGQFSEGVAREYFIQLMDALEECHKNNVYHRDVKLENILLTDDFDIKLCDFGLAGIVEKEGDEFVDVCGTASYLAPEIESRRAYAGGPVDVWGAGIMLFIMLCGFPPFQSASFKDKWYRMLMQGRHDAFWASHQKHADFPELAKALISRMLAINPEERITIAEIRKDPWVNQERISSVALIEDMKQRRKKSG